MPRGRQSLMWMLALMLILPLGLWLSGQAFAEGLLGAAPPANPAAASPVPDMTTPTTVLPGSPTAAIRSFYDHAGPDIDGVERSRFTDPAKAVLDKNDLLEKSGQGDCLDPDMALDNVPYDKAAFDASLKTLEAVKGEEAKVVVAFVDAGTAHRLEWKLKKIGNDWKISDLLSVTGEWALSQYQCE